MTTENTRLETKLRSCFGFKCLPFTKEIEANQLVETETFRDGLSRLRYLIDRRGIGVVYGSPGTGKSTLLRALIDSLAKTTHSVCLVDDTNCPPSELFRLIARGFHLEPRFKKSDVIQDIKERIVKLSQVQKVRPVLVLDDAQRLPSPFLDELRGLTSFDGDRRDELTLILAGHPHLEAGLKLAINEPLAQRIILRVRLRSLYPEEVDSYIAARLRMAGRTARLFLPEAVEAAAKASRGVPRIIDRIGEHCLLIALRSNRKEVDSQIVAEAIDEVDP